MIKSIIIDDEPLAHKVIKTYCERLKNIEIVNSFKNAMDASVYLGQNQVDLIFLDINMPILKGLEFLRTLNNPPLTIITSAYKEYALDSYELNVIDYLLKPFDFERFLKAINKALEYKKLKETSINKQSLSIPTQNEEYFFVKGDNKQHRIALNEILYLESSGSYVKIHFKEEMVMTLERLNKFENTLPEKFVRVHKSYIVAIDKINSIAGNQIFINKKTIPIGQVYKRNLQRFL